MWVQLHLHIKELLGFFVSIHSHPSSQTPSRQTPTPTPKPSGPKSPTPVPFPARHRTPGAAPLAGSPSGRRNPWRPPPPSAPPPAAAIPGELGVSAASPSRRSPSDRRLGVPSASGQGPSGWCFPSGRCSARPPPAAATPGPLRSLDPLGRRSTADRCSPCPGAGAAALLPPPPGGGAQEAPPLPPSRRLRERRATPSAPLRPS